MSASVEAYLASLTPEQYALTVGSACEDPLIGAFAKKRVVHPGVRGAAVPPAERAAQWRRLLARPVGAEQPRAAYVHIPFCSRVCLYCGFFQNHAQEERQNAYIDRLIREMEAERETPQLSGAPLQAVYIGGGTPSALSPADASRLLAAIRRCLPLANDCELTLEARANDLLPEKMEAWFAGGVNRVSVGVQSFDTAVRQNLGRIDARETVCARLEALASYRQAAVVIDLIYGLPGQDEALLLSDLETFGALPIDGMDLYQLNLFDSSPLKKAIDAGRLPPAAATARQAELFAAAETYLSDRAYARKSNCHWAKSERERNLYNHLSKTGALLFPFGAGAGGNLGGMSAMLQRDLAAYQEAVDRGEKPLLFLARQSPSQALHNAVLAQLELGWLHPASVEGMEPLLRVWQERGLLAKGRVLYRLTTAGRFWQMNIAQSLLEGLEALREGRRQCVEERIAAQG